MNDNENKVEAALGGGQVAGTGEDAGIAKELEKSRHTNEVLAGRIKAQGEEVRNLRAEIRALKAGKAADEVVEKLTPEQLGETPKAYAQTAAVVSAQVAEEVRAAQKDEVDKLRAEIVDQKADVHIGHHDGKFVLQAFLHLLGGLHIVPEALALAGGLQLLDLLLCGLQFQRSAQHVQRGFGVIQFCLVFFKFKHVLINLIDRNALTLLL